MENSIAVIGETNFRNKHVRFGIKQPDRLSHMLVVGKTGSGKSTVLAQMMRSDLEQKTGFALLDAHGDLAKQILELVPDSRLADVVYVDPACPEFSPSINLLTSGGGYLAVSQLLSSFRHLWPEFWGPRTEYLLRNALLLLAATFPGACLGDVPQVLTDIAFRDQLIAKLPPGDLRQFWDREYGQYSKTFRSEAISPILNKIGAVIFNPLIRPILAYRRNDIDFREIVDKGKILIVNLSKGSVGEDGSALLGAMILTRLVLAGLARAELSPERRRFFGIYADEAQTFITDSTLSLFSELRKYGVGAVWSAQYLSGFNDSIRAAILGNVGTLIAFTVSGEDAETLSREFMPTMKAHELVSMPTHDFVLKLKIDGATSSPFTGRTIPIRVLGSDNLRARIPPSAKHANIQYDQLALKEAHDRPSEQTLF